MEIYEKIWLGGNRILHEYLVQSIHFDNRLGFSDDSDTICVPISTTGYRKISDRLHLAYVRGHSLKRRRFALFSEREKESSKYFALVPTMLIEAFVQPSRFPVPEEKVNYFPTQLARIRGKYCVTCHEVLEVKGYVEIMESLMQRTDLISAGNHELLIASDIFMSVINKHHFSGVRFENYYNEKNKRKDFKKGLLSIDSFMPKIAYLPEEWRRDCSCGRIGTPDYWTYKTISFSKEWIEDTKDFNLTQERLHGRMVVVKKPVVDALIKEGLVGIQYIPVDIP